MPLNIFASRKTQLLWIGVTFVIVVGLDQFTKALVVRFIEPDQPARYDVFFHVTHQRNTGLVGGMFREYPAVALAAPLAATAVLLYLFRHLDPSARLQALGYGLVLGGAIGNLIDRMVHKSVTDFLQFYFYFIPFDFPWRYYPAFNVADSAICVGVAVLVLTWHSARPRADVARTA